MDDDQIASILSSTPSLTQHFGNEEKAKTALCIYLNRLKTSHTLVNIAAQFKINEKSVRRKIEVVRKCLFDEFVPQHLYQRSRQNLIEHTTSIAKQLYGNGRELVALVWDGTYIYLDKSFNYDFQKKTYSGQQKRNLIKIMMCVTTDGTIASVHGPYGAGENDASIMGKILRDESGIFDSLGFADVMVVDRGFRDVTQDLKDRGFIVKIPLFLHPSKKQFTVEEANESRLVTKTRFIVETRNGHMKKMWKYFDGNNSTRICPHLMTDFKIGASMINAFRPLIITDGENHDSLGNSLVQRLRVPNHLYQTVERLKKQHFESIGNDDMNAFPRLTEDHLKMISFGSYQIANAIRYCQLNHRRYDGRMPIFVCKEDVSRKHLEQFFVPEKEPMLVLGQLASRFCSKKFHDTFVLFNKKGEGTSAVLAYTCSCLNGLRTVGCCSHVMAIIFYICHVDRESISDRFPSKCLDTVFSSQNMHIDSDSDTNNY